MASSVNENNKYVRDARSPMPTFNYTSRVMSGNKASNTNPELTIRKALWHSGVKGYRLHWKNAPGRPDISFPGRKLAVFINGCYWHRCPKCELPLPKSNQAFWRSKFERNIERDASKVAELRALGWEVVTIWECDIKKDLKGIIDNLKRLHNDLGSNCTPD